MTWNSDPIGPHGRYRWTPWGLEDTLAPEVERLLDELTPGQHDSLLWRYWVERLAARVPGGLT